MLVPNLIVTRFAHSIILLLDCFTRTHTHTHAQKIVCVAQRCRRSRQVRSSLHDVGFSAGLWRFAESPLHPKLAFLPNGRRHGSGWPGRIRQSRKRSLFVHGRAGLLRDTGALRGGRNRKLRYYRNASGPRFDSTPMHGCGHSQPYRVNTLLFACAGNYYCGVVVGADDGDENVCLSF